MESKTKKQKLPKWFNGELYSEGGIVKNPFSGEEYELTAEELSMYDLIIGSQLYIETILNGDIFNPKTAHIQRNMARGLSWFRQNNPKAYMVLLD